MKNLLVYLLLAIAAVQGTQTYAAARSAAELPLITPERAYQLGEEQGVREDEVAELAYTNAREDYQAGRAEQTTIPAHIRDHLLERRLSTVRNIIARHLRFDDAAEDALRRGYLNGLENRWGTVYQATYAKTRAEGVIAVPAGAPAVLENLVFEPREVEANIRFFGQDDQQP